MVLAVPSVDGLEATRNAIRDLLGWQDVEEQLKGQDIDSNRRLMLDIEKKKATGKITELVRQAYCIVVAVSDKNEVQAFKVIVVDEPLFAIIKKDTQSRIRETPVTAEALLPGGPYDLWREGETARRMKDLLEAFAQFSQLPKMLNRQAIRDTLLDGCRDGLFVFRLSRPDHSFRTFWREVPDEVALKDLALEVVLPEAATLASLSPALLVPGVLPELWHSDELMLKELYDYFAGRVVQVQREGYEEPVTIPKAERSVVDAAIQGTVRERRLWLISGSGSFLAEDLPVGVLVDGAYLQRPPQPIPGKEILPQTLPEAAYLQRPPQPIPGKEILPQTLPEAWSGETTTAWEIANALSTKLGKMLPWVTVREAIDGAFRARLLERTIDSGPWPCDYAGAKTVKVSLPREQAAQHVPSASPQPLVHEFRPPAAGMLVAEAPLEIEEIQNLNDQLSDLTKASIGLGLKFHIRIELGPASQVSDETVAKMNELLAEVSEKLRLQRG